MSYDINIWSINSVDDLKQSILEEGFKELADNSYSLESKNWQITLHQSTAEDEDVPDEALSLLPGIKYMLELHLEPISAPKTAYTQLNKLAKILARQTTGVIEDKQEDTYSLPSGIKKYNPPKREKEERFSILEMSWWFEHKNFSNRQHIVSFLKLLEKYLPEALPRRYGLYEPPQFKYEETGFEHFVDFLSKEESIVCYTTKPVLGISLGFNDAPGFVNHGGKRKYKCSYITISLDAAVLGQSHWQEHLPKMWKTLSSEIQPFYGDVRILKNYISGKATYWGDATSERHPVKGWWWRGIPKHSALAMVIGKPYTQLWRGIKPASKEKNSLLIYYADKWDEEQNIANIVGTIPKNIAQPETSNNRAWHSPLTSLFYKKKVMALEANEELASTFPFED